MSSKKIHKQRTYGAPYYVQKIDLGNNNKKTRRKPPKLCPDCKETGDYIKLFSNNVKRIEDIINDFYKNLPKRRLNNLLHSI
jgi:hypothetical protein